ncbi:aggregation-promoting factor [Limosilactobacillus caecicola]|uniref:aggregation-promoting factor n=1 Tax=Limosilactobacillus caecicola TaxID=2941332 RepID=UPI00203D1E2E|nr:LysM peptidoglycan-binding domain-containing protein [Limosilactobacillus caecicola]
MLNKNLLKMSATLGAATLGVIATTAIAHADTTYTVQNGDTLTSIAAKFNNVDVDTIAQKNNLQDINTIHVGQKLVIKSSSNKQTKSTAKVEQTDYTPSTNSSSNLSAADQAAKDWIAYHESRGQYTAQNGQYYGKYQLSLAYLNGDLSPENQEKVADQYVANRYGSWTAAQQFWMANGWY